MVILYLLPIGASYAFLIVYIPNLIRFAPIYTLILYNLLRKFALYALVIGLVVYLIVFTPVLSANFALLNNAFVRKQFAIYFFFAKFIVLNLALLRVRLTIYRESCPLVCIDGAKFTALDLFAQLRLLVAIDFIA